MTTGSHVTFDAELCLGCIDGAEPFHDALRNIIASQDDKAHPVFLIHGEGGLDRSRSADRFRQSAAPEKPPKSGPHVLLNNEA